MIKTLNILRLLLLPLACGSGYAQVKNLDGRAVSAAKMEKAVTQIMKDGNVPGLSLAIINGSKIVYSSGFGVRNKATGEPVTEETAFEAGSLSKPVFAYAVLKLSEGGLLKLDEPLYKYLPYQEIEQDERYKLITARMVLSHSSGFVNLRWLNPDKKVDIKFTPGERFGYSGEGFAYLQKVVEKLSGRNLDTIIKEGVFAPLGMTNSFMVWPESDKFNFATGYDEASQQVRKRKPKSASSIGSLHTTARDYAKFLIAVLNAQGLRQNTFDEMLRPQTRIFSERMFGTRAAMRTDGNRSQHLAWGLSFGLFTSPRGETFFHGGHDDGLEHYTVCFRKTKTGVVILTNSSNGESIVEELLKHTIGDTYLPFDWLGYESYTSLKNPAK